MLELSRTRIAATREYADDDPLVRIEVVDQSSHHMAKPSRNAVTDHRVADGFGYYQADSGTLIVARVLTDVDDQVRLDCPHSPLDGGAEVGGPGHPILRGEQCPDYRIRQSENDAPCGAGR